MKIVCTEQQYSKLHNKFLYFADQPKVWGFCPLAFEHCANIPCGEITSEKCRKCMIKNIEWEITENHGADMEGKEE